MPDRKEIPQWRRVALIKALDEGPRSPSGDPSFVDLKQLELFFSHSEITWLCNQALYQFDYQRQYHKKRADRKKEERARNRQEILKQGRAPLTTAPTSSQAPAKTVISLRRALIPDALPVELTEAELDELAEALLPEWMPTEEELERDRRLDDAFARRPLDEKGEDEG